MICIHEVIYSVCSRNFCGILSASEDFMTHDEMMSLLANTLADAAGHAGCLPILDCFSPHPGEEVTVSIPMCDDTVDIVLEDLDFPHECCVLATVICCGKLRLEKLTGFTSAVCGRSAAKSTTCTLFSSSLCNTAYRSRRRNTACVTV